MDVRYSSDDSSDDWESACGRQEFNDLLEGRECGTIWRMRLNLRYVLVAVIVRSVKMTQSLCSYMCVCVNVRALLASWAHEKEEAPAVQMYFSLWAQHETQETASLIITYLSVCPPQGPHVTITDVPHWQARNTHASSNTSRKKKEKRSTTLSLTGVGIQTHHRGGITKMTTAAWAKRMFIILN